MIRREYLGSFKKTAGNTRLYINRAIPPKTVALFLRNVIINPTDTIIEYYNNKNLNALTFGERGTFSSSPYSDPSSTAIPFLLDRGQKQYTYNKSFVYDIQFPTSSSVDIDVFAIVDEDTEDLPFLPVVLKDEYVIGSPVFSRIFKGNIERYIDLNGGQGVFEVRTDTGKEIYKNIVPEGSLYITATKPIYNINEKVVITITNISATTNVKILHLMPIDLADGYVQPQCPPNWGIIGPAIPKKEEDIPTL